MGEVATTKGTILKSLVKFLDKELTPAERTAAWSTLPAEDLAILGKAILASDKVPEFTLNRLTEAAARVKGEGLERFGNRAGRAELADAIGIYRFLTLVLTPKALLDKASSAWSAVHSHGKLGVTMKGPGDALISLVDYPSQSAHCARLTGWFEGLGAMTGVKQISVEHTRCMTRGAGNCEWTLRWS